MAWLALYAICLYAWLDFAGYSDLRSAWRA
jgi:D-alanyl-lipoteichoic acid acyltransferase DltB (MBOAT superfamily)